MELTEDCEDCDHWDLHVIDPCSGGPAILHQDLDCGTTSVYSPYTNAKYLKRVYWTFGGYNDMTTECQSCD